MPILATQHTPAGAVAFAKFFIQTIDWGFATTSSTYMRHYYVASCKACQTFATGLDTDKVRGYRNIGGRTTITDSHLSTAYIAGAKTVPVVVTFNDTSFEKLDQAGKFISAEPALRSTKFIVTTQWLHDAWSAILLTAST
jgi:hypothetical protein